MSFLLPYKVQLVSATGRTFFINGVNHVNKEKILIFQSSFFILAAVIMSKDLRR